MAVRAYSLNLLASNCDDGWCGGYQIKLLTFIRDDEIEVELERWRWNHYGHLSCAVVIVQG